jgi:HK97 family phage portal protein
MKFLPDLKRKKTEDIARADASVSIDDYIQLLQQFSFGGVTYTTPGPGLAYTAPGQRQEVIGPEFRSFARLAYKGDSIVFACMLARMMLFSEVRFQYRRFDHGRPGDLFGDISLLPLEKPWPGGTTGDLLARAIQYADLAGNAFMVLRDGQIKFLRPDWVSILVGDPNDDEGDAWSVDAEIVGYVYTPGGYHGIDDDDITFFLPDEVAHFAPIPDPEARFRGMSWLTPIIREIMADKAMTDHKINFLDNGATPNLIVKLDVPDLNSFDKWTEKFRDEHEGVKNAYKTLFLAAGADATPVGVDMKALDFAALQENGETRIAAAAQVPPILVGLTAGLRAATFSNFVQARRLFADQTMRPLWRNFSGSIANILKVPNNAELWYDIRDISALQDDKKDAALIKQTEAATVSSYISAGFKPDSVIAAIQASDLSLLVHSGLVSVQLLRPGAPTPAPTPNGNKEQNPPTNNGAGNQGA